MIYKPTFRVLGGVVEIHGFPEDVPAKLAAWKRGQLETLLQRRAELKMKYTVDAEDQPLAPSASASPVADAMDVDLNLSSSAEEESAGSSRQEPVRKRRR